MDFPLFGQIIEGGYFGLSSTRISWNLFKWLFKQCFFCQALVLNRRERDESCEAQKNHMVLRPPPLPCTPLPKFFFCLWALLKYIPFPRWLLGPSYLQHFRFRRTVSDEHQIGGCVQQGNGNGDASKRRFWRIFDVRDPKRSLLKKGTKNFLL